MPGLDRLKQTGLPLVDVLRESYPAGGVEDHWKRSSWIQIQHCSEGDGFHCVCLADTPGNPQRRDRKVHGSNI